MRAHIAERNKNIDETVLKHIDFVEGRPIADLAARTGLSQRAVTKSVHRLRDANLVTYSEQERGWRAVTFSIELPTESAA